MEKKKNQKRIRKSRISDNHRALLCWWIPVIICILKTPGIVWTLA